MTNSFAELQKAKHPVYLATTFDGAINGRFINKVGDLSDVTEEGFKKYNERFFAIPNTSAVHKQMEEAPAITDDLMIQILLTQPEADGQDVMIIDADGGYAYLSDSSLPKGEYFGQCTTG